MVRMGIVTFTAGSKTFKFKKPLMLETEYVDGGVCLTHKDLTLSACGRSFSECDAIIREELANIWKCTELSLSSNDKLITGIPTLKKKLLAMVEEVK